MSYSALVAWIEAHFPGADYNVAVATERKGSLGQKRATWSAYVWPRNRTIKVDGYDADQVRSLLETHLPPPERIRFDLIDPENVPA